MPCRHRSCPGRPRHRPPSTHRRGAAQPAAAAARDSPAGRRRSPVGAGPPHRALRMAGDVRAVGPACRVVEHAGQLEHRGTGRARRRIGRRGDDRGGHPPRGQHPRPQLPFEVGAQEVGDLAEVAAEDDGRDVEHVDHAGQGDAEGPGRADECLTGPVVALPGALGELRGGGRVREPGCVEDGVLPGVALEATGGPAGARRSVGVDAHVADLPGPAVPARSRSSRRRRPRRRYRSRRTGR